MKGAQLCLNFKKNMNEIFVFGSNLAGRHGKGAALHAKKYFGAIYGKGVGIQGSSYAIPTKGFKLEVLPLSVIQGYVEEFIKFAEEHPELEFKITPIGTGLAGYNLEVINPLFQNLPDNCIRLWSMDAE